MKVVKAGCLGLVVALSLTTALTVSLPVVRHKKTVDTALAQAAERADKRKAMLKNPELNGFLNAKFEPYWGRIQGNDGPVKDTVDAWSKTYTTQGSGRPVDHRAFVVSKDPEYLKAREAFQALLPDLVPAFSKPIFQPPNEAVNNPTIPLNKGAMTYIACGLDGLAESMLAEGRAGHAALLYEMVFRQGYLVADDVSIIGAMSGVTLQGLAFQSLVAYLSPGVTLTADQWKGLSAGVAAATPTPDLLLMAMQNDLYFGEAFLDLPRGSYDGDAKPLRGAYLIPGFRGRDQRVYDNIMGSALEQVRARGRVDTPPPEPGLVAILKGDNGPGTALLVPNYEQQSALLALHTAKMCGLAATTAVCAYRAQNGKLPASIAELDGLGLRAPGGVMWSQVKGLIYEPTKDKAAVGMPIDPSLYVKAGIDREAEAKKINGNSSYFSLRQGGFVFEI